MRDAAGKPVKGAVVQIENTKTLQIRSYVTKGDGDYDFHGLSTDIDYQISAAFQGKQSDRKMLSRFDNKPDAKIDLQLPS